MGIKFFSKVTLAVKKVLADKAFSSDEIRNFISQEKAEACIPDKSNAVVVYDFDKELYKSRNIVERFRIIDMLKHVNCPSAFSILSFWPP